MSAMRPGRGVAAELSCRRAFGRKDSDAGLLGRGKSADKGACHCRRNRPGDAPERHDLAERQ